MALCIWVFREQVYQDARFDVQAGNFCRAQLEWQTKERVMAIAQANGQSDCVPFFESLNPKP